MPLRLGDLVCRQRAGCCLECSKAVDSLGAAGAWASATTTRTTGSVTRLSLRLEVSAPPLSGAWANSFQRPLTWLRWPLADGGALLLQTVVRVC